MGKTIIEKILAVHSEKETVTPGEIIDVRIDVRLARDFGGANVVKNLKDNNLTIENNSKTFFTFDCNPTGSDQNYAANQQICRTFARDFDIPVFDVAYNFYLNDRLIESNGTVGTSRDTEEPWYEPSSFCYVPKTDTLQLLIQVLNP